MTSHDDRNSSHSHLKIGNGEHRQGDNPSNAHLTELAGNSFNGYAMSTILAALFATAPLDIWDKPVAHPEGARYPQHPSVQQNMGGTDIDPQGSAEEGDESEDGAMFESDHSTDF